MSVPFEFIILSDLHAHAYRRFSTTTKEGGNSRQEACLDCLRYVRKLSRKTGINNVLFSGDLFDAKNRVPMNVVADVMHEMYNWSQAGLQVWMIPGNHDFSVRSGQKHGLEIFEHLQGFHIYTEPTQTIDAYTAEGRRFWLTAYPYRDKWDINAFVEAKELHLRAPLQDAPSVALIHGTLFSDRYTNAMGILPDHEGLTNNDLICEEWLDFHDIALVGHVHNPHRYKDTNILVPGCPWQQHPADRDQQRGIWTCSWTPEETKYMLHEVPGIPKFVTIHFWDSGMEDEFEIDPLGNIVLLHPLQRNIPESTWIAFEQWAIQNGAVYVERMPPSEHVRQEFLEGKTPRVAVNESQTTDVVIRTAVESGAIDLGGFPQETVISKALSFLTLNKENCDV